MEIERIDLIQNNNNNNLFYLKLYYNLIAISINKKQYKYLKYIMLIISFSLLIITISSITKTIINISYYNIKIKYNIIGVQIWMIYGTISYSLISYNNYNSNIFILFNYLIRKENNLYSKKYNKRKEYLNIKHLNYISIIWIILAIIMILSGIISSLITFGPINLLSTFIPILHHPVDNLIFIFLYIANFVSPLPMIIVRISCYFLEQRILGLIEYLESEVNHLHSVPITSIMGWYDDLYHDNEIVSYFLSPFVTLSLLITFPQTIFLLQVTLYFFYFINSSSSFNYYYF